MRKFAFLLLALTLPLPAQETGHWVDPVTSTAHIAANPLAWRNKTVAISASFYPPVKQPDGTWLSYTTNKKTKQRLDIRLTPAAYAYYLERKRLHAPSIYQGEVMPNPADGKLRLNLYKGLTTARHRPAVTASGNPAPNSPPLKQVP